MVAKCLQNSATFGTRLNPHRGGDRVVYLKMYKIFYFFSNKHLKRCRGILVFYELESMIILFIISHAFILG